MQVSKPHVTVYVVSFQFSTADVQLIESVLNDEKGYGKIAQFEIVCNPLTYFYESNTSNSIIVYGKLSPKEIKKALPFEKAIHKMSFTYLYEKPPIIVFNKKNWNTLPKTYRASFPADIPDSQLKSRYRTYLINHEFGHAMSLLHEKSDAKTCPVMYQHTLGVGHCQHDSIWPSEANLLQVQRRFLRTKINK